MVSGRPLRYTNGQQGAQEGRQAAAAARRRPGGEAPPGAHRARALARCVVRGGGGRAGLLPQIRGDARAAAHAAARLPSSSPSTPTTSTPIATWPPTSSSSAARRGSTSSSRRIRSSATRPSSWATPTSRQRALPSSSCWSCGWCPRPMTIPSWSRRASRRIRIALSLFDIFRADHPEVVDKSTFFVTRKRLLRGGGADGRVRLLV